MATRGKPQTKEAKLLDMLYGKPAAGDLRNTPMLKQTGEGSYLRQQYPEVYGFGAGLIGEAPDQLRMGSILSEDPINARVRAGAEYGFPVGIAAQVAPLAGPALKGVKMTGRALGSGLNEAIYHGAESPLSKFIPEAVKPLNVVKPKGGGGNWLNIESHLESIKPNAGIDPKDAYELGISNRGDVAISNWIDTKLNKYIRNEMGTPNDPVRALAEKGKLHFEPDVGNNLRLRAQQHRTKQGYPSEGSAGSQLAADWEALTDAQIQSRKAKDVRIQSADEPFLKDLSPEDDVHSFGTSFNPNKILGFDHIIDELRNATTLGDNLPKVLQIDPAKLERMSMSDVVSHVSKINEWRANQAARAHDEMIKVLEKSPVTSTVKEYPDGYKWVELKLPDNDPKYADELAKALKLEGDSMGHCVGGYCPDVMSGRVQIFSLRDPKGRAHVTIEVNPNPSYTDRLQLGDVADQEAAEADQLFRNLQNVLEERGVKNAADIVEIEAFGGQHTPKIQQLVNEALVEAQARMPSKQIASEGLPSIMQIKGKGNARPIEKYDPYTQDFVQGNDWDIVDDLKNTGLKDLRDYKEEVAHGEKLGLKLPRFVPEKDYDDLFKNWETSTYKGEPPELPESLKKYISTEAAPAYPQQILPAAEADANLAKYLQDSVEKERWYTGTSSDIHEFNPALGLEKPGQAGATFASKSTEFPSVFARDAAISNPHPERQLTPEQVEMAKKNAEQYFRDTYPDMPEHADEMIKSLQSGKPVGEAEDALMNAYRELMPAGPNIMPVYIRTTNPFDFANPEHVASLKAIYPDLPELNRTSRLELPEVQDAIKKAGFDAFYTAEGGNRNIGLFQPTQLKSAIGNVGTYDVTNPLISKKDGGLVSTPDDFTTPDMSDSSKFFTDPDFARFVMEQPR